MLFGLRSERRDILARMIERFCDERDRRFRRNGTAHDLRSRPTYNPALRRGRGDLLIGGLFLWRLWHRARQPAAKAHVATHPRRLNGDGFVDRKALSREIARNDGRCRSEHPSHDQNSRKSHGGQPGARDSSGEFKVLRVNKKLMRGANRDTGFQT